MWLLVVLCAFGSSAVNRRIYNGVPARSDYLYQVAVASNEEYGRAVICGGAIIDNRNVLTAGHCLEQGPMSVRIGSVDLSDGNGSWHEVVKYVTPYINNTYSNDIAMLNVDPPFKFTRVVKPIRLPDGKKYRRLPKVGTAMTVSGWGFVDTENKSDNLMSINLTVISEKKCRKLWADETKKRICVQGSKPGYGTCSGDSGGPLVHKNILYGILSYGVDNCSVGAPEIYTRVSDHMTWIKKQLRKLREKNIKKRHGPDMKRNDTIVYTQTKSDSVAHDLVDMAEEFFGFGNGRRY